MKSESIYIRRFIFFLFSLVSLLSQLGCREANLPSSTEKLEKSYSVTLDKAVPGVLYLRLNKEITHKLSSTSSPITYSQLETLAPNLYESLKGIRGISLRPLYSTHGRYAIRLRSCGLDSWYKLSFDSDHTVEEVYQRVKDLPNIEMIEAGYRLKKDPVYTHQSSQNVRIPLQANHISTLSEEKEYPFNDPMLRQQWYLHNDGTLNGNFVKGADINVFEAWKITTGSPNVIVAVIDEAVDPTHEDLKESMYINKVEFNGVPGLDDDNNGYIDDIYGFNFSDMTGELTLNARGHGTHVASIIAARNNNGIGVCGIAGGDGSPNSGVRIMSCETHGPKGESGFLAQAFVYAADNGAVICNNSWSLKEDDKMPEYLKQAIRYFTTNAGCDEYGQQKADSPMKGGLVIFATGNSYLGREVYPAAYSPVIAVTGMSGSLKKASYANYGSYVDIAAFGGDPYTDGYNADIIGAFPPSVDTNNDGKADGIRYVAKHGTSQAAPQVAGVAALVLSAKGGQGFTVMDLTQRLLTAVRPFGIDHYNPEYKNLLGVGYIDAYKALQDNQHQAPSSSPMIVKDLHSNKVTIEWKVSEDKDDGTPSMYYLYHSTHPIDEKKIQTLSPIRISTGGAPKGEVLEQEIKNLYPNHQYYFALVAEDRWGLTSEPSFAKAYTTNTAPSVQGIPDTPIHLSPERDAVVRLQVSDVDNDMWTYTPPKIKGVSISREKDFLFVHLRATLPKDTTLISFTINDQIGATVTVSFTAIIDKYAPGIINKDNSLTIALDEAARGILLGDYFGYQTKESYRFSLRSQPEGLINATLHGDLVKVTPVKEGRAALTIVATDPKGSSKTRTIQVQVTPSSENAGDHDIKTIGPSLVARYLELRFSSTVQEVDVTVSTLLGRVVLSRTVQIKDRYATLDLHALPSGEYNVTAVTKKEKRTILVVKQ